MPDGDDEVHAAAVPIRTSPPSRDARAGPLANPRAMRITGEQALAVSKTLVRPSWQGAAPRRERNRRPRRRTPGGERPERLEQLTDCGVGPLAAVRPLMAAGPADRRVRVDFEDPQPAVRRDTVVDAPVLDGGRGKCVSNLLAMWV